MKKRFLSLALTLALCLGLTVPAFAVSDDDYSANGYTDPASENVEFSVAPVGVATIRYVTPGSTVDYTVYVFDQDCLVTRKDGLPITHFILKDFVDSYFVNLGNQGFYVYVDVAGISADDDSGWLYQFGRDSTSEDDWSPYMISKKGLDSKFPFEYADMDVTATVVDYRPLSAQPSTPSFTDVKEGDYFAQPVAWAVENKITNGTSANAFSPNENCTVAQILTFLSRAKGSPEPAGTASLPGVDTGAYYYKPAAWALEQGLTDSFSPDAPCTRSMVVTYLWKLAGSPAAATSKFSDVPAGADYAQAVAWAVDQGITSGTSGTTFSPDDTCTRGQIVTFLYRAFVK